MDNAAMTHPAEAPKTIHSHNGDRNEATFTVDTSKSLSIDDAADHIDENRGNQEGCVGSELKVSPSSSPSSLPTPSESLPAKSESETKHDEKSDGDDPDGKGGRLSNDSPPNGTNSIDGDSGSSPLVPSDDPSNPSPGRLSEPETTDAPLERTESSDDPAAGGAEGDHSIDSIQESNNIWKEIIDDFDSSRGGDRKILRAIGRTAAVNAIVAATAVLGPISAVAGYAAGGAITAKRLVGDGISKDDPSEVAKSLAVFGSATSASVVGQAITGAIAIGVLGASLPLAGALAFGVGCASGITAGALSEWGVDGVMAMQTETEMSGEPPKEATSSGNDEHDDNNTPAREHTSLETPFQARHHRQLTPKPDFVDACGAWLNRHRENHRRRQIEKERQRTTRGLPSLAGVSLKQRQSQTSDHNRYCEEESTDESSLGDEGSIDTVESDQFYSYNQKSTIKHYQKQQRIKQNSKIN